MFYLLFCFALTRKQPVGAKNSVKCFNSGVIYYGFL